MSRINIRLDIAEEIHSKLEINNRNFPDVAEIKYHAKSEKITKRCVRPRGSSMQSFQKRKDRE